MFRRSIAISEQLQERSLFLLGPRQTGKSTLLRLLFPQALYVDLLDFRTFRMLAESLEAFVEMVERHVRLTSGEVPLVIVDEVQKLPALLDGVHLLIEKYRNLRFILTGSSARKLRRGGTNLLGGRARLLRLHPIHSQEISTWDEKALGWQDIMRNSGLPAILVSKNPAAEMLSYAELYLRQEIEAESLVRALPEFSRFLSIAAGVNGAQLIYEKVGAKAGLSARTVKSWFQILEDTLFGWQLPSFKESVKRQPVSSPKFYLFDCAIARFLQGRFDAPLLDQGEDLETFLLQEILAWKDCAGIPLEISYWRTKSQAEVDFIIQHGKNVIALEIKTTRRLTEHDFSGLKAFGEEAIAQRRLLINPHTLSRDRQDGIEILSVEDFLSELWNGKLVKLTLG